MAVASKHLDLDHRPDFKDTEPAANIGPHVQWADKKKIVSMDPFGHLAPWLFADVIREQNLHIRPTIAITKAHMKLPGTYNLNHVPSLLHGCLIHMSF